AFTRDVFAETISGFVVSFAVVVYPIENVSKPLPSASNNTFSKTKYVPSTLPCTFKTCSLFTNSVACGLINNSYVPVDFNALPKFTLIVVKFDFVFVCTNQDDCKISYPFDCSKALFSLFEPINKYSLSLKSVVRISKRLSTEFTVVVLFNLK